MKNLVVGILIGMFCMGTQANAVGVVLENFTILDLYCGFAMCGLLSHGGNDYKIGPLEAAEESVKYATALYKKRRGN